MSAAQSKPPQSSSHRIWGWDLVEGFEVHCRHRPTVLHTMDYSPLFHAKLFNGDQAVEPCWEIPAA